MSAPGQPLEPIEEAARQLASGLLAANEADVDNADCLPQTHLDALRDAGLWGAINIALATDDPAAMMYRLGETLAAVSLPTAFVWGQHQGAVLRLLSSPSGSTRDEWLGRLTSGTDIGGVSYSGLPAHGGGLHITLDGDECVLDGVAPFVTSWPWISVLVAQALHAESNTVYAVAIDNPQALPVTASPLSLIAVNASATYRVEFSHVRLSSSQIVSSARAKPTLPVDVARVNSVLALGYLQGVAAEFPAAGDGEALLDATDQVRDLLDAAVSQANPEAMAHARAQALVLAMDAAQRLFRSVGSAACRATSVPARRLREAAFLQTAATTVFEREQANLIRESLAQWPRH